jgi:4-hydroxybenzoyl-CoA thioesterase
MVETSARFLKPSRFGDVVEISSEITALGRSSFSVLHQLSNAGELAAEGQEKRVWVVPDMDGGIRSAPLPDGLSRALGGSDIAGRKDTP